MCESGRLLSTRLLAYDRFSNGDLVYKLSREVGGLKKTFYYSSCSRGKYDGSNYCWKHSTSSSSISMKEIVSKGEQVCESDFPSKCKKGSKSKEIVEQQNALRIHITESLKQRIEELKSKVSCEDRINESITKTSQSTPPDTSMILPPILQPKLSVENFGGYSPGYLMRMTSMKLQRILSDTPLETSG